ncbi:hypothetical protein [Methylomonas koyamae]|uniref:hypothetical protein n=1 Tax=Methylomonas koyamae TaxID=702114 RepID=UPI000BC3384E|nr:hypothetical protein [Methylomonas koyamae]ATG88582.1 hypothetical protein MKLM6_0301 [Methylomonas koyamae]
MDKNKEYELLMQLEIETTKMRHSTFTALLSVSFLLPGLALKATADQLMLLGIETNISKLVFLLGYIFYCFSVFHYEWYHRYAHAYRAALKELEESLDIKIYKNRIRPHVWKFKLHFDWALYIIGAVYGYITGQYVGGALWGSVVGTILIIYFVLFLLSALQTLEPLEK